jgi:hypothetical protein
MLDNKQYFRKTGQAQATEHPYVDARQLVRLPI